MFIRPAFCLLALLFLGLAPATSPANRPDELTAVVHNKVAAYLLRQLHLPEDDVIFEFAEVRGFQETGATWDEVQVLPAKRKVTRGLQIVHCGLFAGRRLQQTVSVKVRVRTFQNVIVVKKMVGRHEIIQPAHLSLSRRETTRQPRRFYTAPGQIVGKRSKRIMRSGDLVTESMVQDPPVVAAGSPVKIHFRGEGIEITMPGIARQDGFANGKVLVKCLETKRNFTAIVQNARSVVVNF